MPPPRRRLDGRVNPARCKPTPDRFLVGLAVLSLAVIATRVPDDAHMSWVAAEVDSGHALRAWVDADLDLQRLAELTGPCQQRLP